MHTKRSHTGSEQCQKPEHSFRQFSMSHLLTKCCSLTKLKSDPHISFMCFNKSSLKMMKNAFYFMLKALFVIVSLRLTNHPILHSYI